MKKIISLILSAVMALTFLTGYGKLCKAVRTEGSGTLHRGLGRNGRLRDRPR